MASNKRALEETDLTVLAKPSTKRAKRAKQSEQPVPEMIEDSNGNATARLPYEYICTNKEWWFLPDKADQKLQMLNKLAVDHPTWKYTIMAKSWRKFRELEKVSISRLPEVLHENTFTHPPFDADGSAVVIGALEDVLMEFNTARRKKNLDEMWMIIAAIGHWLDHPDACPWYHVPGWHTEEYIFGTALVTALEHIDRAGELKQDSKYRDLGLVMAMVLRWSCEAQWLPGLFGVDIYWRPAMVAYAKKAGIDLGTQGIHEVDSLQSRVPFIEPLKDKKSGDRWGWTKTFKEIEIKRM